VCTCALISVAADILEKIFAVDAFEELFKFMVSIFSKTVKSWHLWSVTVYKSRCGGSLQKWEVFQFSF
jgi:hypothetical protein